MLYLCSVKQNNRAGGNSLNSAVIKMKTYDGKVITKKEIEAVLRSMDQTAIFRTYFKLYGIKPKYHNVARFIKDFAPTKKIEDAAWKLVETNASKSDYYYRYNADVAWVAEHWPVSYIAKYFKAQLERRFGKYAKKPFLGETHLYFCSPMFGLRDYNKWRSISIKGNEKLCDLLIRIADKYSTASK